MKLFHAFFISNPKTTITKRYHAAGRQLALRVDDTLYYTPLDPTGTSLTLTDEDGGLVGTLLYDAFGSVLTSTMPTTLTTALSGQGSIVDPATGLVHLGNGRYYDPSMGRPLQPNPFGGPPTVPQDLNRYAATSLGQPGVAEGVANSDGFLNTFLLIASGNTPGAIVGDMGRVAIQPAIFGTKSALLKAQSKAGARKIIGDNVAKEIRKKWAGKTNAKLGIKNGQLLKQAYGNKQLIRPGAAIPETTSIEGLGKATTGFLDETTSVGLRGFIAKHPLGIGLGVDIGIAVLFELNSSYWSNPYLSRGQKLGQFSVNLTFAGIASGATFYTVTAIGISNPVGIVVATIGAGTLYVFGFGQVAHSIIEESGLNEENRRLQPLGGTP